MTLTSKVDGGEDLDWLSAVEIGDLIRLKKLSPVEVVSRSLQRLEAVEPALNSFVTATPKIAIEAARRWEDALVRGEELPPLAGIPVSLKDNVAVAGVPLTYGSRTREGQIALSDSPAAERLIRAGACVVGKTTMTEFGCKGSSDSPLTGVTRNPWNLEKSSGGSSSGSAASVAAGVTPISVGTDGAGSCRVPAAFCGLFGVKPQLGRVPAFPPATAPSLFHIGPIARTVRDAALLLRVMSGYDARDPNSLHEIPDDYVAACDSDIFGWRIAWSPTLGYAKPESEVLSVVRESISAFQTVGCEVAEIGLTISNPYSLVIPEFTMGAAVRLRVPLQENRGMMDPEVVDLLEAAAAMSAKDYFDARFAVQDLRLRLLSVFKDHRLLLTPTLPVAAFDAEATMPPKRPLDETIVSWPSYTGLSNLLGFPAASVPCGFTSSGLPIGLQIIARPNCEKDLFAAAAAFEMARGWDTIRSKVVWSTPQ